MKRNQPSQRDQHLDRTHGEANMTITQPEPQLVEVPAPTKQELAAAKRLDVRESNIAAREAAMKVKEQQYAEAVEALRLDREAFEASKTASNPTAAPNAVVEDLVKAKLKELAGHLPPQAQMVLQNPQLAVAAIEAMLSSAKTELSSNGARVAFTTPFGVLRAEAYLDPIRQPAEARKAGGSFEKSSDDIVWLEPVNGRVRCEPFEIEF